jgi:hypothetical protein
MRKLFFAFIAILASHHLSGQVSIQSKHMPSAGDTARLSISSPLNLPSAWEKRGSNISWDFSKLTPVATQLREFKSSFRTPYAFYFLNRIGEKTQDTLDLGPLSFTNIYSFYSKSSSVIKTEGLGYTASGIPLAAKYSDEDELYQFPLEYNDSDVTTFRFKFEIPGQQVFGLIQAGTRYNVVDAYGSIKTPYKNYKDVIRVKTIIDEVDTIVTPVGKNPIPRKQIEYKWLSQNEIVPILQINGLVTPLGSFQVSQVIYRDSFRSLSNGGGGLNPPVTVDFDVDKTKGSPGEVFKITNKSTPFLRTFNWSFQPANGVQYVNGSSSQSSDPEVSFSQPGLYSVTLNAEAGPAVGDTTYTDLISIEWGSGNQDYPTNTCLSIFPVPAKQHISVNFGCPTLAPIQWPDKLLVYDNCGRSTMIKFVSKGKFDSGSYDISNLSSGLYFLPLLGRKMRFVCY